MDRALAGPLCQARGVGRGKHRGNLDLFLAAPGPPQEHEVDKHAGAVQRGDKARTRVVRIFPNEASCLRLVRALAVEQHERWQEDHRYLNMAILKEAQRDRLKAAA